MLCVLVRFPLILRCSNISQETRNFDKLSTFKIPSLVVLPCTEWKWGLRSIYTHGIFKLGLSTYSNYHGTEGFLRRQWQGSGASLLGIPLTWGSVEMESHSFHKLALLGEVLQVPDANTQTEGKMRLPASLGQLSWTLLVVWVSLLWSWSSQEQLLLRLVAPPGPAGRVGVPLGPGMGPCWWLPGPGRPLPALALEESPGSYQIFFSCGKSLGGFSSFSGHLPRSSLPSSAVIA